jgi:3-deoxy-D-manno-octulosonate 8-phosphate phosphatase (KDO 8-P phosphatase)
MVNVLALHELRRRARRVTLLLSDVDGVLTDSGVYYSERGEELKRFSRRDGMAVELLRDGGIKTGLLSRERSPAVLARAQKLALSPVFLGVRDKLSALDALFAKAGVTPEEVAYIGDDVNDLEVLGRIGEVGLTAAPADAAPAVKAVAQMLTEAPGGHGAFREFADSILHWRLEEHA